MNLIAATDFLGNMFVLTDFTLTHAYLNIHAKLVSDLQWIFLWDAGKPVPYLVTCSFDGFLKIWTLSDTLVPLYSYFSSKVNTYSLINVRNGCTQSSGILPLPPFFSTPRANSSPKRYSLCNETICFTRNSTFSLKT